MTGDGVYQGCNGLGGTMMFSQLGTRDFVLRLEAGDDILDSLQRFAERKRLRAAAFQGIGSLNKAKLGHYDFKTKEYTYEVFDDDLEILSLEGNISSLDQKPLPHAHATLGRRDFSVIGGHLDQGSLANMVEIVVQKLPGRLVKVRDEKMGLNLLQLLRKI
jgi:hypothetical protein